MKRRKSIDLATEWYPLLRL
uniref:Uncharacterized protein n=1 Tax=Rhizophora mucronata TaxID=61149 RepID=A0A2P2Q683_RHIMU